MKTFNNGETLVTGIAIGTLITLALAAFVLTNNPTKRIRPLNKDYVDVEQRRVDGVWMWHVYYDDGEFEYEVSDRTLEAAMKSMHELVNI